MMPCRQCFAKHVGQPDGCEHYRSDWLVQLVSLVSVEVSPVAVALFAKTCRDEI